MYTEKNNSFEYLTDVRFRIDLNKKTNVTKLRFSLNNKNYLIKSRHRNINYIGDSVNVTKLCKVFRTSSCNCSKYFFRINDSITKNCDYNYENFFDHFNICPKSKNSPRFCPKAEKQTTKSNTVMFVVISIVSILIVFSIIIPAVCYYIRLEKHKKLRNLSESTVITTLATKIGTSTVVTEKNSKIL